MIGLSIPSVARAANGTWASAIDGLWSNSNNWAGGTIADGAGGIATFSFNLSSDLNVHLDSSRTIGALNFSDTQTPFLGYLLDNGGTATNILTLAGATSAAPIITVGASTVATISLNLAGTNGLAKAGSGILVLSGNNTYSGETSIFGNVGSIRINSDSALGSSTLSINNANGGIQYGSIFNNLRDIFFGASGGRIDTNGFDVTYSSTLSGTAFSKAGLGTLTLEGTNNISTAISVGGGLLRIDSDARLGASQVSLSLTGGGVQYGAAFNNLRALSISSAGGTIDTNGFAVTYSSTISGSSTSGSFTKAGAGTLRLTDNNTYKNRTVVNAGTLLINGDQTQANNTVTVNSGATLGGIGIVGGATTINSSGILAPGDGVGTLTINSSLSMAGGSVFKFDGGDLVAVNGALTLANNWVLSLGAGLADGGSVTLFTYGSLVSVDLTPVFDLSQLGFTPTGQLSLSQVGNTIVLNGVQAIPEPSTYALIIVGLGAMVWMHRVRRRTAV